MSSKTAGAQILAAILSKQGDPGVLANDLLGAIRAGFSMEELRVLLASEDSELVSAGVWIQSELGASGRPLLQLVRPLLRHELKYVRFFAIDSVLGCATEDDSALIADVLTLIHDAEASVRWKVIDFLARAPIPALHAVQALLQRSDPESEVAQALRRFVDEDSDRKAEALLRSDVAVFRRFGLALAMRQKNRPALELAVSGQDDEVRDIAKEALERQT